MNNTIGNNTALPVLPAAPRVSVPVRSAELPREPERPATQQPEVLRVRAVERRQVAEARPEQPIANTRILGTDRFVSFLDAGGKVVTRIRTEDGKIRYIPEPELTAKGNTGRLVSFEA